MRGVGGVDGVALHNPDIHIRRALATEIVAVADDSAPLPVRTLEALSQAGSEMPVSVDQAEKSAVGGPGTVPTPASSGLQALPVKLKVAGPDAPAT